jgi:hypothetical protein
VRRELVLEPVTRDERDLPSLDRPDGDRRGRLAPRRVELDLRGVLEQRVEAGATEYTHSNGTVGKRGAQADFSFEPEPADESDPDDEDEPEEESDPDDEVDVGADSFFAAGSFCSFFSLVVSEELGAVAAFFPLRESVL